MVEPVAWQVKDYGDGWITVSSASSARELSGCTGDALVRPLYAEPVPPPAQEAAGAVTREELITLIDQHVEAHCTYADDLYVIGQEDAAEAILSRLGGAIQEPEETEK